MDKLMKEIKRLRLENANLQAKWIEYESTIEQLRSEIEQLKSAAFENAKQLDAEERLEYFINDFLKEEK